MMALGRRKRGRKMGIVSSKKSSSERRNRTDGKY
jgi:hypothetical protein